MVLRTALLFVFSFIKSRTKRHSLHTTALDNIKATDYASSGENVMMSLGVAKRDDNEYGYGNKSMDVQDILIVL